jgi:hypothetical protein
MSLPLFSLLQAADEIAAPGELIWEMPHEEAEDASQRCFQIDDGRVILTVWRRKLHEVIYQTPLEDEAAVERRNVELFKHYGEGHSWNEILDNGFGKTYRRADMQRYALWSYAMDFNTFGTMEFHKVG